mgnify:CR=1 FL=1
MEVKLLSGDELRLRHKSAGARGAWEGTGHVVGGERGGLCGLRFPGSEAPTWLPVNGLPAKR